MIRIPSGGGSSRSVGLPSWDDIKEFASDVYNEVEKAAPVVVSAAACIATENPAACAVAAEQAYAYYQDLRSRGKNEVNESGQIIAEHVETHATVHCGAPSEDFTIWRSSSFYPESVCGIPGSPPFTLARVIPNTGEVAYTEPNTYLFVRTGEGFEPEAFPRVGKGAPPAWAEVLGYWGNSPLYVHPDDIRLVSPAILAGLSESPGGVTVLDQAAMSGAAGTSSESGGDESGFPWGKTVLGVLLAGGAWAAYRTYKRKPVWPF